MSETAESSRGAAGTGKFQQVSVDDTLENELRGFAMIDQSVLHAKGLRGGLSQAVGEEGRFGSLEDLLVRTYGNDRLGAGAILASDGAWKGDETGFASIARHAPAAYEAMRRLLAFATWTETQDNISIIAIEDLVAMGQGLRDGASVAENHVSLLIGENKFTICGVAVPANIASAEPILAKPRRRYGPGHKSIGKARRSKSQMDPTETHRDSAARPNVEITTNDNET